MENISQKAREFVVECHEKGLTVCVGIADAESGQSIRAMDGQLDNMLILLATLFMQLGIQTGEKTEKLVKQVLKIVKTHEGEKNGKSN